MEQMNNKIFNKKTIKPIFVFTSFAVAVFIIFILLINIWGKTERSLDDFLVDVPGMPPLRVMQMEDLVNDKKLLTNIGDGYQITAPKNWGFNELVSLEAGLQIRFPALETLSSQELMVESRDGLLLNIRTLKNENQLSITNWLVKAGGSEEFAGDSKFKEVKHPAGVALRSQNTRKDEDEQPISDSTLLYYVIGNKEHIYIFTCSISGENFSELTQQCEDVIQTFEILE